MEKKIKVTIEITDAEMPILLAYSHHLAKGHIHPDAEAGGDQATILALCRRDMPALKGLMYKLSGAGIDVLGQFHRDALILVTKMDEGREIVKEAERWSSECLGLSGPDDASKFDLPLKARIADIIAEHKRDGFPDVSEREIAEQLPDHDMNDGDFKEAIKELVANGVIVMKALTDCDDCIYAFGK